MNSKAKILIIEDESAIASVMADYLIHDGYAVEHHHDGNLLMDRVLSPTPPDLLLLDVMLPGKDGLTLCRDVREKSDLPIIMVTARVEEVDRLLGLELGADDYICKPFSPREVVARVRALLRRTRRAEPLKAEARIHIDEHAHRITLRGENGHCHLDLTDSEFRILRALATHPGVILSRSTLLEHARGHDAEAFDRTVDSHIKNLRRKMAAVMPDVSCIQSVYGVGYRFEWSDES